MLINFLIIGAQKAGTTALNEYLWNHPEIYIPPCKEVHFFDNEHQAWRKRSWLNPTIMPITLHSIQSPTSFTEMLHRYTVIGLKPFWLYSPKIKLILCLRNPIDRAWAMDLSADGRHFRRIHCTKRCKKPCLISIESTLYIRGFYMAN